MMDRTKYITDGVERRVLNSDSTSPVTPLLCYKSLSYSYGYIYSQHSCYFLPSTERQMRLTALRKRYIRLRFTIEPCFASIKTSKLENTSAHYPGRIINASYSEHHSALIARAFLARPQRFLAAKQNFLQAVSRRFKRHRNLSFRNHEYGQRKIFWR